MNCGVQFRQIGCQVNNLYNLTVLILIGGISWLSYFNAHLLQLFFKVPPNFPYQASIPSLRPELGYDVTIYQARNIDSGKSLPNYFGGRNGYIDRSLTL